MLGAMRAGPRVVFLFLIVIHYILTLALAGISITRPCRRGVDTTPPGVSKLSVVALREKKKQSIALEYSRLVVYFLTLGQHLT